MYSRCSDQGMEEFCDVKIINLILFDVKVGISVLEHLLILYG